MKQKNTSISVCDGIKNNNKKQIKQKKYPAFLLAMESTITRMSGEMGTLRRMKIVQKVLEVALICIDTIVMF